MANAYTPGLKVTEQATVRKTRRLPILGEVLVQPGQEVRPDDVVARASLPGNPQTVNLAALLGVGEPQDVVHYLLKKPGDPVKKGEVIARTSGLFGLFKKEVTSPIDGTIEMVSTVTGQAVLREPPIPVEVTAYIKGKVVDVIPREGAIIETTGAFIQGIFGVGGERRGIIDVAVSSPDDILDAPAIGPQHKGKVVVGGSLMTGAAIKKAAQVGASALVAGGIIDTDLVEFLGHDIGVAITGHEDVPLTLMITEGFGRIRMAQRTFDLFRQLAGEECSINGATQIRAGVMRPEVIVPGHKPSGLVAQQNLQEGLAPGMPVRIIREPYFGLLAEVVDLPPELQVIETEAKVRILHARLQDGRVVTIPRANVEIIES